jgi:hypothetical protein
MILEERRNITRRLISEGGCGCGGCSTCKSNLSSMFNVSTDYPMGEDEHEGAVVISYGDDGLPLPKLYMDHADAYDYEQSMHDEPRSARKSVTMGGRATPGHDITHGDDYGQSYMAKQHLNVIINACHELDEMIHGDEELEDWCESKLAVAANMVQAVKNFVAYHKSVAHEDMESVGHGGMHTLARVLSDG